MWCGRFTSAHSKTLNQDLPWYAEQAAALSARPEAEQVDLRDFTQAFESR
jgi:hypothetical protein